MTNGKEPARLPRHVRDAINRYLSEKQGERPLSTSAAVRALRPRLSKFTATDAELADAVASVAIGRGFNLNFDAKRD